MSKLSRRLKQIGSQCLIQWACVINNDPARTFNTESEMLEFIKSYRELNTIFNLNMSRIEIYSL